ncbi:ABC transporter ATP-binding protein [Nocardia asteroides]|uniref:ABC transporter ATP-binding protein n=1 Tax=Nocardia asteroides TaxID=1824 RepID=UPI001E50680F|nr:ATP-binding cassette domain-containing protein [Nocardia asteroides]UGT63094.1 ATP-binding cassette domain-containing protein [Nocardia asteroides]
MNPVAEITALSVTVGDRVLLAEVDLRVGAGEIVALVGGSGSGKTTTALALFGEFPPGAELRGSARVAGRAAFVPQHPATALDPVRRIGSALRELAGHHGSSDAATALRRAHLPGDRPFLRRFPHQLSGGQQQRLLIAQALLGNPVLVVADEPTTGQDPVTRAGIVDALRALRDAGIAVLVLCHDLDVVRALADRVIVLDQGRVVEEGPVAAVFSAPAAAYTRALVAAQDAPPPRSKVSGLGATTSIRPDRARRGAAPGPSARAQGSFEGAWLEITDLAARHHRDTVLSGIILTVEPGTCLGVVGRSGSGKTTLARCLAGLHTPATGEIRLNGTPLPRTIDARGRTGIADVQYVFQDAAGSFDQHRPILEQIARTAIRLRGLRANEARAAAAELLERLGLPASTTARRPAHLSGGELQRAALARALLARPRLLIADEITTALDTVTRAAILDVLAALGTTRVVIAHDLAVIARIADTVAVLHDGRLVEHGPAAAVLA